MGQAGMTEDIAKAAREADSPQSIPQPSSGTPLLRIDAVIKTFGQFRAVDALSLDIHAGEFFALLGPSGCGKTTLLRMLAGFEAPDAGRILLDGKDIAQVPPHQRPVNMMFQNYALFPHLNVRDNIAFGLKRAGMSKSDINARVSEMVALVKLDGLEKRKPDQLSGGQRQRVALERRLGLTFIIVTHDQQEAMTMAGRIGVMDAGRLEQVATPRELYEAPRSRWIAEFVGDINLLEGKFEASDGSYPTMARRVAIATSEAGTIYVAEPREPLTKVNLCIAIRPEKVKLSRLAPASDDARAINRLDGVVTDVSYLGGMTSYKVKLDTGAVLRSSMANTARLDLDAYSLSQRVVAWFSPEDCVVLEQ